MATGTSGTTFSYTEEYDVRPGAINLGGFYEFKMVALLSLRCIRQKFSDMWIAFNGADLGAWDDIIINGKRQNGEDIKIFLQLKHEEKGNDIDEKEFLAVRGKSKLKLNFSILKYLEDILNIKSRLVSKSQQTGIIEDLETYDNTYFVLFTNKGTGEHSFLKREGCDPISFLNTSSSNDNVYKFDLTKVSTLSNLPNLDYNINFNLFAKQSHVKHLDKIIETEMKNVFRHFGITNVNIENISKKFIEYVTDWAMGNLGNHYYLTKQDILYKLTELLLSQYEVDLSREEFEFYDSPQKLLWNEVIKDKVITVVDSDEEIIEFLKLYVGSEMRQYYHKLGKSWSSKLSNGEQSLFYKQHPNLKKAMLKIVGNDGAITLLNIYKCLWFNEHLPLLLKINTLEDYDHILKILKLSNYKLKVIVLNTIKIMPPIMIGTPECFATICDLNDENRLKILNNSVKLQGRASVLLKELIDDSLLRHIDCNAIINILLNNFNVGMEYEPLSEYFVKRRLVKVFLKIDVLKQVHDETFVIEINESTVDDCSRNELDVLISTYTTKTNIIVYSENILKQLEDLELRRKPIHRVIFHGKNLLEWKESSGSTSNIRKYQFSYPFDYNAYVNEVGCLPPNANWFCNELEDILPSVNTNNFFNGIHLVSASPGMGKSTLLDYIASKASTKLWVLNVKLIDHDDYYANIKSSREALTAQDHLKYFYDSILETGNCSNNQLAEAVFQKFLARNRVLVMLDGLDEVSVSCKNEVLETTKCLLKAGCSIWLTTRPHLMIDVEEKFATISTILRPFTVDDQTSFLNRYFKHISATVKINKENHQILIGEFVKKLLEASRDNLSDIHGEFMGIPLQTKLLANAFSNELKHSLCTGIVHCEHRFDLLYLFEEFMKRKDNILRDKFGKGAKDMKILFQKHQQLFAVKLAFSDCLYRLDIDQQLDDYYKNNEDQIQFLQQDGVTVIHRYVTGRKFHVSFVHRTFAEYMAAVWLLNNFNSDDVDLRWTARFVLQKRGRMYTNYGLLFRMFDSMLARHCRLHMLIINGRTGEAQKLVSSNPDVMDALDACGRSFLHMVALYGVVHRDGYFKYVPETTDGIIDFVEQIPKCKIINTKDKLGYMPLDYALITNAFAVGNKLCEKTKEVTVSTNMLHLHNIYIERTWLFNWTCKTLTKRLLPLIICQKLLLDFNSVNQATTIVSYCKTLFRKFESFMDVINDYTKELEITTIADFLTKTSIKSATQHYYYDLRFAAAFGTSLNVLDLILSEYDQQGFNNFYTPLHWAVKNNRLDIVKILLYYGENANESCIRGETPLHHAAENGYTDIVRELLSHQTNVNVQNDIGDTPLILAIRYTHTDVAKLLLSNNARVNIKNSYHCFPLYYAADHGLDDIIHDLLKGVDINYSSINDKTPLHIAIAHGRLSTARLLLLNGADPNILNKNNELILHSVAEEGLYEILPEIVSKTVNNEAVNITNKRGQTPLHLSLYGKYLDLNPRSGDRVRIVNFFLNRGSNSNIQDIGGNNALHYLCEECPLDRDDRKSAVKLLLDHGVNVNQKNNDGKTPLQLCLRYIFSQDNAGYLLDIVPLFLSHDVKVNIQDSDGNTVLHYLCGECQVNKHARKHIAMLLLDKGADVNLKNKSGKTPLLVFLNHLFLEDTLRNLFEIVPLLLNNECNVNIQDIDGNTALHYLCRNAISNEDYRKRASILLLDKGADVNLKNNDGKTPFHLLLQRAFVQTNSRDIFRIFPLLLTNQVNVNIQDGDGNTVLHDLCMGWPLHKDDRKCAVMLLLNKGGDVTLKNNDGQTPLHLLLLRSFAEDNSRDLFDIFPLLLSKEVNVNIPDNYGDTLLHYLFIGPCPFNKDTKQFAAMLLFDKGADVNLKNNDGKTALHYCLYYSLPESNSRDVFDMFCFLLRNEIKVNIQDTDGNTALHYLCKNCPFDEDDRKSAITLLLDKGADVSLKNELGESVLSLALLHNFTEVIKLSQQKLLKPKKRLQ